MPATGISRFSPRIPVRGFARIVNADPVTGRPAVLGEIAEAVVALDAFGRSWGHSGVIPLDDLRPERPELHDLLIRLAEGRLGPAQLLVRFDGTDAAVVQEDPLPLTPDAQLRFSHALFQAGAIGEAEFLAAVPPSALAPATARLEPGRNRHLREVGMGTPFSGAPFTGILAPHLEAVSDRAVVAVVDRIEANHTALTKDPRCVGICALRGSGADHFALLARERGFPYVILEGYRLDDEGLGRGELRIPFGTSVTVDTTDGRIYVGEGAIERVQTDPAGLAALRLLAERRSPVSLRLNIDAADDLAGDSMGETAGVGLLRTEHMLRRGGMDGALRAYLEASEREARTRALADFGTFFRREFTRCFALAGGRPIAFRLLDYPLHELRGAQAREVNPMLGLRGVRQGLRWPPLYLAQIDALFDAAATAREQGIPLEALEILVPLISHVAELRAIRAMVTVRYARHADSVLPPLRLGAMVETPAAALDAEAIASECDFLSFGTNDLTQFTLGLSREDYGPILRAYRWAGLSTPDPFEALPPAVLGLIRDAARRARRANPRLVLGLCGAHAAEDQVLALCTAGLLDYVSVPGRLVPVAKLRAIRLGASRGAVTIAGGNADAGRD